VVRADIDDAIHNCQQEDEVMRDVMELLRAKEQELLKLRRQVEALRVAAPLLGAEEDKGETSTGKMAARGANTLG
jgi:hypothetical protein